MSQHESINFLMYKDHMTSTVAFARDIIRYCFILNGAAATAIMAAGMAFSMKWALLCFGLGAFLSSAACTIAYLYQHSVTMSWQENVIGRGSQEKGGFRYAAFILLCISLLCFFGGGIIFAKGHVFISACSFVNNSNL